MHKGLDDLHDAMENELNNADVRHKDEEGNLIGPVGVMPTPMKDLAKVLEDQGISMDKLMPTTKGKGQNASPAGSPLQKQKQPAPFPPQKKKPASPAPSLVQTDGSTQPEDGQVAAAGVLIESSPAHPDLRVPESR